MTSHADCGPSCTTTVWNAAATTSTCGERIANRANTLTVAEACAIIANGYVACALCAPPPPGLPPPAPPSPPLSPPSPSPPSPPASPPPLVDAAMCGPTCTAAVWGADARSEEHTSELQSR